MEHWWRHLSRTLQLVAGASAVVVVGLFLPWYGIDVGALSVSVDGFHSYGLLSVLGVLAAALSVLRSSASWSGRLAVGGLVLEALGAALFLLAYHGGASVSAISVSFGPQVGVYLTLLASLVGLGAVTASGRLSR